jgi:hypothetical protein
MKILFFITVLLSAFGFLPIYADSRQDKQRLMCSQIQMMLDFRLTHQKKEIPVSWDELENVRVMKEVGFDPNGFEEKMINAFALVPGAPVIPDHPGISKDHRGHRLFMINREEVTNSFKKSGRHIILIRPEGLNSKPFRILSYFIPEETALLILKQFPDFDPAKQPLAFSSSDRIY